MDVAAAVASNEVPRVLIVEGDDALRQVFAESLPEAYQHRLVSSLGEARAVMAHATVAYAGIIADARAEEGDVFEWVGGLRYQGWKGHVLVSSAGPSADLDRAAARVGAGFVWDDGNPRHLAAKFRFFLHKVSLGPRLMSLLHTHGAACGVTPAEQRVLDLSPWISARLICETLGRKLRTVEAQVESIARKSGVEDLNAALLLATAYRHPDAYRQAAGLPLMPALPAPSPALLLVASPCVEPYVDSASREGLRIVGQAGFGRVTMPLVAREDSVVGIVIALGDGEPEPALTFVEDLRSHDTQTPILCFAAPMSRDVRARFLRQRVKLVDPDSAVRATENATARLARYARIPPDIRSAILVGFCERHGLTDAHRGVLEGKWAGFTREDLSDVLGIRKNTVRAHFDAIRDRVMVKRFVDVMEELSLYSASVAAELIASRDRPGGDT